MAHPPQEAGEQVATERVHHEIAIARDVQRRLLPQSVPALQTVELAATCIQARSVGGDYYDFLNLDSQHLGLVIADVSGKGLHAALRMANLQAHLRSQAAVAPRDPLRVLRQVNRMLCESTDAGHFATLFLGVYSDPSRRLTYINCGHNPPLCLRADGSVTWLHATATVIGAFEEWECALGRMQFGAGDLLVAYSDGITEASDASAPFGEARLVEAVRGLVHRPPEEIVTGILDLVRDCSGGAQADDLTLLIARVR
jgi:serine phosphatase RsbU (regulator of sigma subunit)